VDPEFLFAERIIAVHVSFDVFVAAVARAKK
jgi:hypothetical protein